MESEKQLILADGNLKDVTPVMNADADFAIGTDENNFEISIRRSAWDNRYTFGNVFYIKNTEFGGIIGGVNTNTSEDTISLLGRTWRGKLDKKIIKPPNGSDYRKVSGELNQVLDTLIKEHFGSYFVVSQKSTGISVDNYQFERYCTLLSGIEKMLKSVEHRIQIRYIQQERGEPGYVEISAVPIVNYSQEKELSQDSRLNFSMKRTKNGVNHLICLGKGELQDRQVIDLYVQTNGTIGKTQCYTGIQEVAETYEDTVSESEELEEKGRERLRELMDKTVFSMEVERLEVDVEIGDIIAGRDYTTGAYIAKPIAKKIYKMKNGTISVEYEIEGDEE